MTETLETIETFETPDVPVEPKTPLITQNDLTKTVVLALVALATQQAAIAVQTWAVPKLQERRANRKSKKETKAAENATLVGVK